MLRLSRLVVLSVLLPAVLAGVPARAAQLHVAPGGGHQPPFDSWAKAATDIQSAIDAAAPGDEVVVSNGIYDAGSAVVRGVTNRIAITNAIRVRSVNGPEVTSILATTNTYFSPDVSNVLRCTYVGSGAELSGFTLRGGMTASTGDYIAACSGGGAWCEDDAVISNCVIVNNWAYFGGGGVFGGIVRDSVICSNSATFSTYWGREADRYDSHGYGGGALSSRLERCTIRGNEAWKQGGGIHGSDATDCTIDDNEAHAYWRSSPSSHYPYGQGGGACRSVLSNCVLRGNDGGTAGGGAFESVLTHCTVVSNTALSSEGASTLTTIGKGGGLYACSADRCFIEGNWAAYGGGAWEGDLTGCVLRGNNAEGDVYQGSSGQTVSWFGQGGGGWGCTLVNCTVVGNRAWDIGGGVHTCDAVNSIVCRNQTTNTLPDVAGGSLQNCMTSSSLPSIISMTDLHLWPDSSCVDGGAGGHALPPTDLDGNPRVAGSAVDIGAYEYQGAGYAGPLSLAVGAAPSTTLRGHPVAITVELSGTPTHLRCEYGDGAVSEGRWPDATHQYAHPGTFTILVVASNNDSEASASAEVTIADTEVCFVSPDGSNTHPYTTWETAAHAIQDAVDAVPSGGVVLVADGVYSQGVRIVTTPGPVTEKTRVWVDKPIIVKSMSGPEHTTIVGASLTQDRVRGAYVCAGAELHGFTVRGGYAAQVRTSDGAVFGRDGGGVLCEPGAMVSNCVLFGNQASMGGGIHGGLLFNSVVISNYAANQGGGACGAQVQDCRIDLNRATDGGGVALCEVSRCLIRTNNGGNGGGAYVSRLTACELSGNGCSTSGGGAYGSELTDCLLSDNVCGGDGGAGGTSHSTNRQCVIERSSGHHGGGTYASLNYDCVIRDNSSWWGGGGTYCSLNVNCIIVSNDCTEFLSYDTAGGTALSTNIHCVILHNSGTGKYTKTAGGVRAGVSDHCVVYHNTSGTGSNDNFNSNAVMSWCVAPQSAPGIGNSTNAPEFGADWRLVAGNACIDAGSEICAFGHDPDGVPRPLDGDGDGVARCDPGVYEFASATVDSDDDGVKDWHETRAGTNPLNEDSLLRVDGSLFAQDDAGDFVIRWPSVEGKSYRVAFSTNIVEGFTGWVAVGVSATAPENAVTDRVSIAESARFYRVIVE